MHKVNAEWTTDCGGKMDYDSDLLKLSTRYWPDHTAKAQIYINVKDDFHGIQLATQWFEGETKEDVQDQVEKWVNEQFNKIIRILLDKGLQ
jgi:hypothetical protein